MLDSLQQLWYERKPLVIIVSVIAILSLLGGVGFIFLQGQNTNTQLIVSSPDVTLSWWKVDYEADNYRDIIRRFNDIPGNENVSFNITDKELDNTYYRDLLADIARGIGPDILTLQNNDLPAYKEFLSPNDVFRGSILTRYRDDFVNLAVRDTMDKDKVFCTTSTVDTLQLYYNEDLLQQSQIPRPATTWDELDRQIPFLRRVNIGSGEFTRSPISLGTGGRAPEGKDTNIQNHGDIVSALIFQYGGQLYDYQSEKSVFGVNEATFAQDPITSTEPSLDTTSPSYKAIEFYDSFTDPNNSRYAWNRSNPDSKEMFAQSRLVYTIGYRSFFDEIKQINPRLNIDVNPLPQINEQNTRTFGRFNMDCLNARLANEAQNPLDTEAQATYQKAQEFMEFLTRSQQQIELANKTGLPAAHKDAITDQLQGDKVTKTFAEGALNAEGYYQPDVNRVELMWSELFEKVQYNNVSLEDATDQAVKEYNAIINAKPKLRT